MSICLNIAFDHYHTICSRAEEFQHIGYDLQSLKQVSGPFQKKFVNLQHRRRKTVFMPLMLKK